eukprot:1631311-Amphidinium_carterae.1
MLVSALPIYARVHIELRFPVPLCYSLPYACELSHPVFSDLLASHPDAALPYSTPRWQGPQNNPKGVTYQQTASCYNNRGCRPRTASHQLLS